MTSRFLHESGIVEWLREDFPEALTSQEGQRVLEKRADEIVNEINNYFHPEFCMISENAKYLKEDLENIRKAYEKKDYKLMGKALEQFKSAVDWI